MQKNKTSVFLQRNPYLISGWISLTAILFALVVGGLLMLLIGKDPILAYRYFFYGIIGSAYGIGETMTKFVPLLCCALGFAIAQKSGFFNMGAEGQLYMGALGAVLAGVYLPASLPPVLHIFLSLVAGMVFGALCSALAGILKILFSANELLNTMMLNYLVTLFISLLVSGPLKDPAGLMEQTKAISDSAKLSVILPGTRLHSGLIISLVAAAAVWFFYQRTCAGFEMRLSGNNHKAALYAGVNTRRSLILAILISGALSGLGGMLELSGNQYRLLNGFSGGYGFDAIGIAVMGQYNPIGIILSAILFAALRVGAGAMQRGVGIPLPMVYILQGIIIVSVIVSTYFVKRITNAVIGGRA